ncbi:small ribosomal subunit protein bS16m-like [Mytilus trossulus]|uniref:small ribosomal subunit protein bS16m-like n=1 Tax=Mytilus trossulus TaxID=6551 RepID=UPI00300486D4
MPRIADRSKFNIIRLALHGCTNRPFYQIVVCRNRKPRDGPFIERLGSYDPMPNKFGERHVALDVDRFFYNLAKGTKMTKPVEKLFGLSGLLPIHPMTYIEAERLKQGKDQKRAGVLRHWNMDVFEYYEEQKKKVEKIEASKKEAAEKAKENEESENETDKESEIS